MLSRTAPPQTHTHLQERSLFPSWAEGNPHMPTEGSPVSWGPQARGQPPQLCMETAKGPPAHPGLPSLSWRASSGLSVKTNV